VRVNNLTQPSRSVRRSLLEQSLREGLAGYHTQSVMEAGNSTPRKYGPAELMALKTGWTPSAARIVRPNLRLKRDFKNFLKKLGIWNPDKSVQFRLEYTSAQIEMRYNRLVPNRRYKYFHFKNGGTWHQLHQKGRWNAHVVRRGRTALVTSNGDEYRVDPGSARFFRVNKPRSAGKGYKGYEPFDRLKAVRYETSHGPVYVPPKRNDLHLRVQLERVRQLDRVAKVTDEGDINVLGGRVLPLREHRKYWYFLRKRGIFTFSEHHPYGNEAECFDSFYKKQRP